MISEKKLIINIILLVIIPLLFSGGGIFLYKKYSKAYTNKKFFLSFFAITSFLFLFFYAGIQLGLFNIGLFESFFIPLFLMGLASTINGGLEFLKSKKVRHEKVS